MKSIAFASALAASASAALAAGSLVGSAPLAVSNVSVSRDAGTHRIRVSYDLSNENDEPAYVVLDVQTNGVSIGWEKFRTLSGDVTRLSAPAPVACGTGKELVWDAPADWPGHLEDAVTATVTAHYTNAIGRIPGVYAKIDVSGGPDAESYPVSYGFDGPDMTDTARPFAKDFIYLRCIGPGSFRMGAGPGEGFRSNEKAHVVAITKPFWIGVFEITEYQYRQVVGSLPSGLSSPWGDDKAVTRCSYNILRGTTHSWPASSEVDAATFLGKLRAKTGLAFDLPTEAQWEYACRAGCDAMLHNRQDLASESNAEPNTTWLRFISWFVGNRGQSAGPAEVGKKAPNDWLLYDMIGNADELVLDWYAENNSAYTVDPVGPASGSARILRGGAYDADAPWCRSAFRLSWNPGSVHQAIGCRIALPLD